MENLKMTPARSILPNSTPEILKPIAGKHGTFQVKWVEEIDSHVLFYKENKGTYMITLAAHHNGYSCHHLAMRCINETKERALEQLEYIRTCGGLVASKSEVDWICRD